MRGDSIMYPRGGRCSADGIFDALEGIGTDKGDDIVAA